MALYAACDLHSKNTVRTHLTHAFAKTGTREQSELLPMIDRVLAAAPRAECDGREKPVAVHPYGGCFSVADCATIQLHRTGCELPQATVAARTTQGCVAMKTLLLTTLLALASWPVHAQSVTASTDLLEFPPTLVGTNSPWQTMTLTNQTGEVIDVYGLGWAGSFGFNWDCSPTYVQLEPYGSCTLYGQFKPRDQDPLGVAKGLVGFRVSTGTVLIDVMGFSYTNEPLAGVRNLIGSMDALGVMAPLNERLKRSLAGAERILTDGRPANDRAACGRLRLVVASIEQEAARERVSDWSAIAIVVQAEAVTSSLGCRA